MHPSIQDFPSIKFYNNKLLCSKANCNHVLPLKFLGESDNSIVFFDVQGTEEKMGTSYFNLQEIKLIGWIFENISVIHSSIYSIGIITAYDAQRIQLLKFFSKQYYGEMKNILEKTQISNIDKVVRKISSY